MTVNKYLDASNNMRYRIDGWHIIDTKPPKRRIYIRELIEVGCHEFTQCKITASERMQIIEEIGQEQIFSLMREVFEMKGRIFNEGKDGIYDIQCLKEMAQAEASSNREFKK